MGLPQYSQVLTNEVYLIVDLLCRLVPGYFAVCPPELVSMTHL